MFQFVYWLKAIAAALITNSHYADIWPISAMAAGGHFGNCLFFLVSGFCMYSIKETFPKWYMKRIVRIYPALWIAVAMNLLVGFFIIDSLSGFVRCFFYPTRYHFITSIMILYVLYYLVRKLQDKSGVSTSVVIGFTAASFFVVYLFWFDKSWYHIDNVEENWVRFQFWTSMLLGAWLREKYESMEAKISAAEWLVFAVLFVGYFMAKVLVSRVASLSSIQFLSPLLLVMLTFKTAKIFIKMEKQGFFTQAKWACRCAEILSSITLEIYLVQNVIIKQWSHLVFPLNFLIVTVLILLVAWSVHLCAKWIQEKLNKVLGLIK